MLKALFIRRPPDMDLEMQAIQRMFAGAAMELDRHDAEHSDVNVDFDDSMYTLTKKMSHWATNSGFLHCPFFF